MIKDCSTCANYHVGINYYVCTAIRNRVWETRTDCKNYQPSMKLSCEITTALDEAGYKSMPLPKEGCKDFKPTDKNNNGTDKIIFR